MSGPVVLDLHVQPGAKRTGAAGRHGERIKLRLAAPPVDGAATDELVRFLAGAFGVRKRDVTIVSGATSRAKRVRIEGATTMPDWLAS